MFITFEGIDGSGKTTQLRRVAARLDKPLATKEPGGTPTADRIRAVLLDQTSKLEPLAEALLLAGSRHQHVVEVIRPALEAGRIVLCDRYVDSTLAFQGFGRLLDLDRLRALNDWATGSLRPDFTLLFDIDEETGVRRARGRGGDELRFEAEDLRFYRRVREGYLALATAEPKRFLVIDAHGSEDEVFARVERALREKGVLP